VRIEAVINFVATDATYTQVYAGCWTYMEMGIAVISGNLPLLRPLFGPFFHNKGLTTYASENTEGRKADNTIGNGSYTELLYLNSRVGAVP
jgi:hypothetical protein